VYQGFISVEDCDQTEILVTGFESSSGLGSVPGPVDVSNPVTSISVWSQSSTEITLSISKGPIFTHTHSWVLSFAHGAAQVATLAEKKGAYAYMCIKDLLNVQKYVRTHRLYAYSLRSVSFGSGEGLVVGVV
jgi:hypothetical protein